MRAINSVVTSRPSFKSKRGISPLIATVLLIAFAVALGAVVMSWGRGYIESTATFAEEKSAAEMRCTMDVELGFAVIDNQKKVCVGNMSDLGTQTEIEDALEYPAMIGNTEEVEDIFGFDPVTGEHYIDMVVENGPSTELKGLQISVLGTDEIVIYEYNRTIGPAGLVRIQVPWDIIELGEIEQVKVLPRIYVGGADTDNYCVNSAIISSYILGCND